MESVEVKLHGFFLSPYAYRVIWALKLKGINYEYIEENLSNKSQLLLQYNPVYKKVPVLVHGGKPVAESLIILQYIEETWPDRAPLLPKDAHERALARFWIKFAADKSLTIHQYFIARGQEELEKAAKEALGVLQILEEECLGDKKYMGGDTFGLVDISYGWLAHWLEPMEEAVGVKVLDRTTLPRLHAWIENFKQIPVIKDNFPDHGELCAHFRRLRDMVLSDPSGS